MLSLAFINMWNPGIPQCWCVNFLSLMLITQSHCSFLLFLLLIHAPLAMLSSQLEWSLSIPQIESIFQSQLLHVDTPPSLLLAPLSWSIALTLHHCQVHYVFVPDLTNEVRTPSKVGISWVLCSVDLTAFSTDIVTCWGIPSWGIELNANE